MNTVFLLFSLGVFTFYTVSTSENPENNQVENTSRVKPPKFLWDPDKRMWIESDDEDFYGKGYSGDGNDQVSDLTLDNPYNQTDTIDGGKKGDDDNIVNDDDDDDDDDDDYEDEEEEGLDDELFTFSSTINQAATTTNPIHTIAPLVSMERKSVENTSVGPLVKYEEKVRTSLENPLNQALDLSTIKNSKNNIGTVVENANASRANVVVEVNPATESPLWALEFESKRTKPLQKEWFIKPSTTESNTYKNINTETTKLQVIPLADNESHDVNTNTNNSIPLKDSKVINVVPVSKKPISNISTKQPYLAENAQKNSMIHNISANLPANHNSEVIANETIIYIPIKTNIQIPFEQSRYVGTNFENKTAIKSDLHVQRTTTIVPDVVTIPVIVFPESILIPNDTSSEEEGNERKPVSNNNTNLQTSVSEQVKITTRLPDHKKKPSEILSTVIEVPTSSRSEPIKINGTVANGTPNLGVLSSPCPPSTTTLGTTTLHWPETPVNVTIIPKEICLKDDETPVTRTCLNGVWSDVNGTCLNVEHSLRTVILNELLHSNTTNLNISKNLTDITTDNSNITSYEVHLMSELLERVASSSEVTNVNHVVTAVNNIMHYDPIKLRSAQNDLNSTDKILNSLDTCLLKINPGEKGYRSIVTDKLFVQEVNLQKTDFSGFKVASSNKSKGFQANDVSTLNQTKDINDASTNNLELAMLIPKELNKAIKQCNGSQGNPVVISTVFYDDTLFNSNATQGRSEGKVISILLPGFNCSFAAPLQVIFRPPHNSSGEQKCAFWRYGSNEHSENIKGEWIVEGKSKPYLNTTLQLCEFSHATHFSLLVLGDLTVEISEADEKALNIITAVGSGLSLLGLLAVLLTALVFRSYRSANAVVIHFSIAMAAQIILLFMANHMSKDALMCTIFGAALHYIVLSQFCWMLTIALLQYKRYVLVFSNPTKYLMVKACAFAWGLPLIPVAVIVSMSTDNYRRNSYGLCYAVKNYFIFGVLIPVALIVFVNLLVFLRIMIYIASRKIKAHRKMDNATSLQLRLAIMLYFLLGLTWGFGLVAAIGGGIIYSYLFCITATLQGFVLFLFFIALSDKTRSLWGSTIWCPCFDKKKKYDVSTDSSSHPMVRRPTSTNTSDTFTDGTGNDVFHKYKNRSSMDF